MTVQISDELYARREELNAQLCACNPNTRTLCKRGVVKAPTTHPLTAEGHHGRLRLGGRCSLSLRADTVPFGEAFFG